MTTSPSNFQFAEVLQRGPTMNVYRCPTCHTSFLIPECWTVFTCGGCAEICRIKRGPDHD